MPYKTYHKNNMPYKTIKHISPYKTYHKHNMNYKHITKIICLTKHITQT